jgi:hypothetical protein
MGQLLAFTARQPAEQSVQAEPHGLDKDAGLLRLDTTSARSMVSTMVEEIKGHLSTLNGVGSDTTELDERLDSFRGRLSIFNAFTELPPDSNGWALVSVRQQRHYEDLCADLEELNVELSALTSGYANVVALQFAANRSTD